MSWRKRRASALHKDQEDTISKDDNSLHFFTSDSEIQIDQDLRTATLRKKRARKVSPRPSKAASAITREIEERSTSLSLAARHGNVQLVKFLLRQNCEVDHADKNGWTALHWAARYGYAEVVEQLIQAQCEVNIESKNEWTALHIAARYGHYDVVRQLLKANCLVDVAHKKHGWTALHFASHYGFSDVVKLLLDASCAVDTANNAGRTALHLAILAGYEIVAEQLLSSSARVDICDREGDTPLHKAVPKTQKLIILSLIKAGANMKLENKAGRTPISLAGRVDVVALLRSLYIRYQANELERIWVHAQHSPLSHDQLVSCIQSANISSLTCFVIAHNLLLLAVRKRVTDKKRIQTFGGVRDCLLKRVYLPATKLKLTAPEKYLVLQAVASAEKFGFIYSGNEALVKFVIDLRTEIEASALEVQKATITLARNIYYLRDTCRGSGEWIWESQKEEEFKELGCNQEHMYADMQDLNISLNKLHSCLNEKNESSILEAVIVFCLTIVPVVGRVAKSAAFADPKTALRYSIQQTYSALAAGVSFLPRVDFSSIWTAAALTSNEFAMKLDSVSRKRLECVVRHSKFKTLAKLHSQITSAIDELQFIKPDEKEDEGKASMRQRFCILASRANMDTISAQVAIEELKCFLDRSFPQDSQRSKHVTTKIVELIDEHSRVSMDAFLLALDELKDMYSGPQQKAKFELVHRFRKAANPDTRLLIVIAKAVLLRLFQECVGDKNSVGKEFFSGRTGAWWNDSFVYNTLGEYATNESSIDEDGFVKASMKIMFCE